MKRKLLILAALLFTLKVCTGATWAAEATPPVLSAVYPAEVRTSEENGIVRVEKVYNLTAKDDPAAIPTGDFDREGRRFTLLDVLKNDLTETDSKDYVEVITLDSKTKDVGEIIKVLDPELEIVTEDGYSGTLKPDYTTITVEAAGYKTSKWPVSATRTYPDLSDADLSLLPKSIEDSGRTLTLADVDWQSADGANPATHYTAVATYTGTATSKNVTGYTVTVDYAGEVSKTTSDTVIYTAIFTAENASHGETHFDETEPVETEAPVRASGQSIAPRLWAISLGLVALGGLGYGAWRGAKYYRDKKRGYVK